MTPADIAALIQLITLAGQYGTELYLKIKAIGELGPDEQANVHQEIAAGIGFDQSVKDKYAQWRVSVGLDPAPAPPVAPIPTPPPQASTVHDAGSTIPPAESASPAAPLSPAAAPQATTVHDASSTIPPSEGAD